MFVTVEKRLLISDFHFSDSLKLLDAGVLRQNKQIIFFIKFIKFNYEFYFVDYLF